MALRDQLWMFSLHSVISNETKKKVRYGLTTTQKAIIFSRSTIETPQKGVKYVQS